MKSFKQYSKSNYHVITKGDTNVFFPYNTKTAIDLILPEVYQEEKNKYFGIIKRYFSKDQGKGFQLKHDSPPWKNSLLAIFINKKTGITAISIFQTSSKDTGAITSVWNVDSAMVYDRGNSALKYSFDLIVQKDFTRLTKQRIEMDNIHGKVWGYKERWVRIPYKERSYTKNRSTIGEFWNFRIPIKGDKFN